LFWYVYTFLPDYVIGVISQNTEFFVVMNLKVPWKVEISQIVG
jgi:hypothetical protein